MIPGERERCPVKPVLMTFRVIGVGRAELHSPFRKNMLQAEFSGMLKPLPGAYPKLYLRFAHTVI